MYNDSPRPLHKIYLFKLRSTRVLQQLRWYMQHKLSILYLNNNTKENALLHFHGNNGYAMYKNVSTQLNAHVERGTKLIPKFLNNTLFKINLHFDVIREHLTVFSINRCIFMNTVRKKKKPTLVPP
jgi:hypothetical protein